MKHPPRGGELWQSERTVGAGEHGLEPLAAALGKPVAFAEDCIGPQAEDAVRALKAGEVLLLENLRFHKEEEKNDQGFIDRLSVLGDVYVNDAFSTAHRAHASTEGIANRLPAAAGRLMQAELEALDKALGNPKRPVCAVVGGAKVSTKIELLHPLGEKSPIANFLTRNADGGIHHVCYEVDDLKAACDRLVANGARVLGEPKIGAHGTPVLFLHPKDFNGTLVEVEEVA